MASKSAILMWSLVLALLFAGLPDTAESKKNGAVPLGAGGGALRGALFNAGEGDATFSFYAGYDKYGEPRGHFVLKRVTPGKGVRRVVSKEITDVELGFDDCPYVMMSGRTVLHAWWVEHPQTHREYFFLQAWDCDGIDGFDDMIWFGVYRALEPLNVRPGLTLEAPVELTHGNINIPY